MAYELSAEARIGKNPRELRRRGKIPGVVYGPGVHQLVVFERKDLERLLSRITRSSRLALRLDGHQRDTFIKEIQYDLFTDQVIHLDLYQPAAQQPITLEVPIRLRGESKGRKSGGIVDQLREVVQVRGRSAQMPELIELDITELDIGQALHASDVQLGPDVQLLTPPDAVLVTILAPRKEEEVAPVAVAVEGEAVAVAEGAEGAPSAPAAGEAPKTESARGVKEEGEGRGKK
jgi:large subunit ribosomal protein L25